MVKASPLTKCEEKIRSLKLQIKELEEDNAELDQTLQTLMVLLGIRNEGFLRINPSEAFTNSDFVKVTEHTKNDLEANKHLLELSNSDRSRLKDELNLATQMAEERKQQIAELKARLENTEQLLSTLASRIKENDREIFELRQILREWKVKVDQTTAKNNYLEGEEKRLHDLLVVTQEGVDRANYRCERLKKVIGIVSEAHRDFVESMTDSFQIHL